MLKDKIYENVPSHVQSRGPHFLDRVSPGHFPTLQHGVHHRRIRHQEHTGLPVLLQYVAAAVCRTVGMDCVSHCHARRALLPFTLWVASARFPEDAAAAAAAPLLTGFVLTAWPWCVCRGCGRHRRLPVPRHPALGQRKGGLRCVCLPVGGRARSAAASRAPFGWPAPNRARPPSAKNPAVRPRHAQQSARTLQLECNTPQ